MTIPTTAARIDTAIAAALEAGPISGPELFSRVGRAMPGTSRKAISKRLTRAIEAEHVTWAVQAGGGALYGWASAALTFARA